MSNFLKFLVTKEKFVQREASFIPLEFGGNWAAFVEEWCCGSAIAAEPVEVAQALSTLVRLWPEKVENLINRGSHGPAIIAPEIDVGLLLHSCESAKFFDEVFRRLVKGERSAYSEFVVVASLLRSGYFAQFAPRIAGRIPDAKCLVEDVPVYFEVVAPEPSDASKIEQQLVKKLNKNVREVIDKCRVEIELFNLQTKEDIKTIAKVVQSINHSEWKTVSSVCRVRKIVMGRPLVPAFDGTGAQTSMGGSKSVQTATTKVIIRWETSDSRAKRVLNDKYTQLTRGEANVLVINVSAVSDGFEEWPTQIAQLLQSKRNRKVSAVIFFDQGCVGPLEAIRRRWRSLINPFAHVEVPEVVINNFESLDESKWFGLPQHKRIFASEN